MREKEGEVGPHRHLAGCFFTEEERVWGWMRRKPVFYVVYMYGVSSLLCGKCSLFICSAAHYFWLWGRLYCPIVGWACLAAKAAWKTFIPLTPSCIYISGGVSRASLSSVFCLCSALLSMEKIVSILEPMSVPRSTSQAFKVSDKNNVWQPTVYISELNALFWGAACFLIRKKAESFHISNIAAVIVGEKVGTLLKKKANQSKGNHHWLISCNDIQSAIFKWDYKSSLDVESTTSRMQKLW